ncbi:MAG: hypothetical protein V7784_23850, partial [Oceanospirillaceae bacterium]
PDERPDSLPKYGHTPLVLGQDGDKLSKQTKASPIEDAQGPKNLFAALAFLGQDPPQEFLTRPLINHPININNQQHCTEILAWGIDNWSRNKVPADSSVAPTLADA